MPHKDPEARRAAKRKSAARRREAGICSRRRNKRLPGDSRCGDCREKQRQAERVATANAPAASPFSQEATHATT